MGQPRRYFYIVSQQISIGVAIQYRCCAIAISSKRDRIIPARLRDEGKELEYLRTQQSFIWVALPFTFSFIAVERFFDGGRSGRYEALGFLAMAVLTFVVGVCWERIIPRRPRYKADHSLLKAER